jgi:glucose-1-phosphate adenylyltransferase
LEDGSQYGVLQIDDNRRIINFREKPDTPAPLPDDSTRCLASMGIYVFNANFLFEELCRDATQKKSEHDFGKNIVPSIIDSHLVRAFPFRDKNTGDGRYWRDVGTLDAYYQANMNLIAVKPQLNLYDRSWEIRTYQAPNPPPKFVFAQNEGSQPRIGQALDSMVCAGSIISGGRVERSIISPNVRVNSWAHVQDSILFEGVNVGRHAAIRRAIIDKGVSIPAGTRIGFDPQADHERGFVVTESGVVVIGKVDLFHEVDEIPVGDAVS